MKERQILFSGEMVRALLEGRKTQTRRVVKPQPPTTHSFKGYVIESSRRKDEGKFGWGIKESEYRFRDTMYVGCPYGQPGDRLWVREAHGYEIRSVGGTPHEQIVYRASKPDAVRCYDCNGMAQPMKWRPSIHMPRWACRILLEVVSVRVERLQEISEADARSEGAPTSDRLGVPYGDARTAFIALWDRINFKNGHGWGVNPWVWVVEFKRITP